MATHSDMVELTKALITCIQDVGKCKASIKVKWDAQEISVDIDTTETRPSANTSLDEDFPKEENALLTYFRASFSAVQLKMKTFGEMLTHLKDKMDGFDGIPDRQIRPDDGKACLDLLNVVGDRLGHLEETVTSLNELKMIRERLGHLEEMLVGINEFKTIGERFNRLELLVNGLDELKTKRDELICPSGMLSGLENLGQCLLRGLDINSSALTFHPDFKGKRIELTNNSRTATRKGSHVYWGFGGVTTRRHLNDAELFEVRVDETIDNKYTGSMAIGVVLGISHNVSSWERITQREGTWSLYCNTTSKDSSVIDENYPLDLRQLTVGTVVGLMRRRNGDIHFYKNGVDQGVAFTEVPSPVYGFVDVTQNISKITISNSM